MANRPAKKKPAEEPEVRILQDREEAAEFVRRVGELKIEVSSIVAQAEARIAKINQEVTDSTAGLKEEMEALVDGLFIFFETNSPELTEDGARRSVDLVTGVIGERLNPWRVEVKKVEDVLARLREMGISDLFVRQIQISEINKSVMLASAINRELAANVRGITIVREEVFFVSPVGLGGVNITKSRRITIGKQKK